MEKVGENSIAPGTVKEAISLARKAKMIVCPVPGDAGGSVKIVKADYIEYLKQMLEYGNELDTQFGHTGGVLNLKTGVMSL